MSKYNFKTSVMHSRSYNPWFNLAVEDWIFNDMDPNGVILYLWRNSETVVIGRYQNPWVECRLDKMRADGVKLARRQSGGGAVYHDLNNLNFTIMSGKAGFSKEDNFRIIINALKNFNIQAELSGRNDLITDGRKFSGSAFKMKKDRSFHHGTLLIDTDLGRLSNYLNPDNLKLKSKGIKSVKSRVTNLKSINEAITVESLSKAVCRAFFDHYGEGIESDIDIELCKANKKIVDYYDLLRSDSWLYEKSPDFSHRFTERFIWGAIELNMDVKSGIIDAVKIFSDALCIEMIECLEKSFNGNPHRIDEISIVLEEIKKEHPAWTEYLEDVASMLSKEITF